MATNKTFLVLRRTSRLVAPTDREYDYLFTTTTLSFMTVMTFLRWRVKHFAYSITLVWIHWQKDALYNSFRSRINLVSLCRGKCPAAETVKHEKHLRKCEIIFTVVSTLMVAIAYNETDFATLVLDTPQHNG